MDITFTKTADGKAEIVYPPQEPRKEVLDIVGVQARIKSLETAKANDIKRYEDDCARNAENQKKEIAKLDAEIAFFNKVIEGIK